MKIMKNKSEKRGRTLSTLEAWMMVNGKSGDIFYSIKKDKDLTAISSYYKVKIKTERLFTVTMGKESPIADCITKVTLL